MNGRERDREDGAPKNPPLKGVRDPRFTKQFQGIENPRPDANRDIIALQRRWLKALEGRRSGGLSPSSAYFKYLNENPSIPPPAADASTANPAGTPNPPGTPNTARALNSEPPASRERPADRDANLTLVQYRYTKALEVVNDEMGYGECVTEIFWQATGDGMRRFERRNQRTKSGRQVLELDPRSKSAKATSGHTTGDEHASSGSAVDNTALGPEDIEIVDSLDGELPENA